MVANTALSIHTRHDTTIFAYSSPTEAFNVVPAIAINAALTTFALSRSSLISHVLDAISRYGLNTRHRSSLHPHSKRTTSTARSQGDTPLDCRYHVAFYTSPQDANPGD